MSRARILADYVSSGDELALKAPLAGPTFTGTVAIPNVANLETAVVANTAKITNATHTGDVTGGTGLTIATDAVDIAMLSATGIASSTTFLRGDNTWVTPTDTNTVTALDPVVGDFDYGQTWTDYTPSSAGAGDNGRAIGTVYTNTTGKPIFVFAGLYSTAGSTHVSIEINGDNVGSGYIGAIYHRNLMMFYVPDDATYSCPSGESYNMVIWHEFR